MKTVALVMAVMKAPGGILGPVTPMPTSSPVVLATVTEFEFAAVAPPVSAVVLVEAGSKVRLLLMVLLP
ncbi:MAG: hypothetical protein ACOVRP_15005, partial [Gemmatimonas sp.]